MGTPDLGCFELFDQSIHFTGLERSELSSTGMLLTLVQLKTLPDKKLTQKNSRVLVYYPNED
jgi:hypothetical protein